MVVTLATRIVFGVLLYDGSLNGFAWALFLATVASAPVTALQQSRYFGLTAGMMVRALLPSAVVAIGNAPTALFHLLEILADGAPRPAVILGFPVGFVGAAEAKEALIGFGVLAYQPLFFLGTMHPYDCELDILQSVQILTSKSISRCCLLPCKLAVSRRRFRYDNCDP